MINDMSYNLGGISVSLLELFFHLIAGHHFPRLTVGLRWYHVD